MASMEDVCKLLKELKDNMEGFENKMEGEFKCLSDKVSNDIQSLNDNLKQEMQEISSNLRKEIQDHREDTECKMRGLNDRIEGVKHNMKSLEGKIEGCNDCLMTDIQGIKELYNAEINQVRGDIQKVQGEFNAEVKHIPIHLQKQIDTITTGVDASVNEIHGKIQNQINKIDDIEIKIEQTGEAFKELQGKSNETAVQMREILEKGRDSDEKLSEEVTEAVNRARIELRALIGDVIMEGESKRAELKTQITKIIDEKLWEPSLQYQSHMHIKGSNQLTDSEVSDKLARENICFTGSEDGMHPIKFVEVLENRFINYSVSQDRKLAVTLPCFQSQARLWLQENIFTSYEECKSKFIECFWGHNEQAKLLKTIYSGVYPGQGILMSVYFKRLIRKSNYLSSKIPESVLVRQLISHFPETIRIHLLPLGDDPSKVASLLERLESENLNVIRPVQQSGNPSRFNARYPANGQGNGNARPNQ